MGALERAQADIEEGRLWKARDRLEGFLDSGPHDQRALGLLADVCIRMGDLPAAGKYLFLTERWDGDDAAAARDALEERCGRSAAHMLRALPAKPPLEAYPSAPGVRLRRLVEEARSEGYVWGPRKEDEVLAGPPQPLLGWKGLGVVAIIALLTVGVWCLGIVFLLQLIF